MSSFFDESFHGPIEISEKMSPSEVREVLKDLSERAANMAIAEGEMRDYVENDLYSLHPTSRATLNVTRIVHQVIEKIDDIAMEISAHGEDWYQSSTEKIKEYEKLIDKLNEEAAVCIINAILWYGMDKYMRGKKK